MTVFKNHLNKPLRFGKYKGKTPKELIDSGKADYIKYLSKNNYANFTPETFRYIDTNNKK